MSDDTTTWLKKNPSINPLRRSLKTSLRFHVPSSDMNNSIMSNPDKVKDQGLFIPRMLQKSNMQMRKSRLHEFKVPEVVASKPVAKKEGFGSGGKHKKIQPSNIAKKSMLPVPKAKSQITEKPSTKANLPRPSFVPGVSGRRSAKRELMKKVIELSEIKRKEEAENLKIVSGDSSVLRSILKKRASLRRSSQISSKKPKAKKVLFDGFENSDGEKENVIEYSLESQNDFNRALDEPTVFLNFPNGANVDESPFEFTKPRDWTVEETKDPETNDIDHILKLWESYKENLDSIQTERNSLENSFESLLQQSMCFQKQYQAYKETSEEMYSRLSKLSKEIEEKLKKAVAGGNTESGTTPESRRKLVGRRGSAKGEKIKMSDKSKIIKKSSGRKSVPLLKKEILSDMDDSFSIISSKSSFLEHRNRRKTR